ncbi:basic amino acid/polyamine antiporter [Periweissella ghanensis]|uniref:Arginine/ornithine antiporter ArcD1 n=1 Tax=Periweissella ghanensis TaxID=467997 RepID=A0ABM8Z9S2_9LACO|nr:basic amino acid/polyamine antiporter [Periweissella ghanensis]MCM0600422.1 amino acid permease [Periweissella ghanensis]CAH0418114.1 Arginine/ornithine antiporter ArcD1 [Periweissella ghanensis]
MNTPNKTPGIALPALVALVISSAIGAGIFDLPTTFAKVATPGPVMVAWLITGLGILMLALSLKHLVLDKPELTGVADYARAGFGDFAGFLSGWGYWLSAWLGNVAFASIMMSAFGYFFPSLKSGNSISVIVFASIISWGLTLLVTRGVEAAAVINTVVTICKLIPLFAFAIVALVSFKAGIFTAHFWVNFSTNIHNQAIFTPATTAGIIAQIKGCILSMMWVFVGIEGAAMMAGRAQKKSDAGRATIIGLLSLLTLYVVISLLPYGYLTQNQLLKLHHPALVYLFKTLVGDLGGAFISIGLIISIMGSWLSWTMLPVEATSLMAKQKLLPQWFGKLNQANAPANSLWLTQILVQIFLISLIFTTEAYNFAYSLCTAAIVVCYVLVGAYELKLGLQQRRLRIIIPGLITCLFEITAIMLAGWQLLWLCTIAYLLGFILYIRAKKEHHQTIKHYEWFGMGLISIIAVFAIIALFTGSITI